MAHGKGALFAWQCEIQSNYLGWPIIRKRKISHFLREHVLASDCFADVALLQHQRLEYQHHHIKVVHIVPLCVDDLNDDRFL